MTEHPTPTLESLTNDIKQTTKTLEEVLSMVSKKKYSSLETLIWNLRADLEFLISEFKYVLEIEDKMERWQKNFFDNLRGTKSQAKASDILKETILSAEQTLKILDKTPKECYKYFWKVKETISSILPAFEGKKTRSKSSTEDDIFEI